MTEKNIVILPGDGIGQEVVVQAEKVMKAVADRFNLKINTT
ncbi:MAG: 3-isopropylmalate dehydrogenase, partial [bacterium]